MHNHISIFSTVLFIHAMKFTRKIVNNNIILLCIYMCKQHNYSFRFFYYNLSLLSDLFIHCIQCIVFFNGLTAFKNVLILLRVLNMLIQYQLSISLMLICFTHINIFFTFYSYLTYFFIHLLLYLFIYLLLLMIVIKKIHFQ